MLFAKKNNLVGLDIGSKTLKLCEVFETRKKGFILNKFGMITLPNGAIEDGVIKDPETVSEAICELFKVQKIREKMWPSLLADIRLSLKKFSCRT